MQIKFKVANIRLLYYPAKRKNNQPNSWRIIAIDRSEMCNSPPIIKKQACISIQGWRGCVQNWTRSKNSGWTSRKCELSHSWLNFGRILAPISTRRVGSGQPGTIPSAPSRLPSSPVRFQWLQPATRDRILPRYQSRCYQSERIPLDSFVSIISIFRLGEGETRKL